MGGDFKVMGEKNGIALRVQRLGFWYVSFAVLYGVAYGVPFDVVYSVPFGVTYCVSYGVPLCDPGEVSTGLTIGLARAFTLTQNSF